MPRPSRNLHRLIGARQSRTIPAGTACPLKGCGQPATHVVLGTLTRGYCCTAHAPQVKALGYEMFAGERQEK